MTKHHTCVICGNPSVYADPNETTEGQSHKKTRMNYNIHETADGIRFVYRPTQRTYKHKYSDEVHTSRTYQLIYLTPKATL